MQTDERTEGGVEKQAQQRTQPLLRWPLASSLLIFAVVVLLGAGFFFLRSWNQARTEPLGIVQTPVSTVGVATLAAIPARAQEPAAVSTLAPTAVPTVAATPVPAAVASGATAPQATPTGALAQSVVESPLPTAIPTVDPQVADEVKTAYERYWDVTAQALRDLDATHLTEVAMDGELVSLQKNIEDLRAQGKAIDTSVEHHFNVVWSQDDQAQVNDRYRDRSIFIDPSTKQPLAGEVIPPTFEDAPESNVAYLLQRDQGTWKVVGYNNV